MSKVLHAPNIGTVTDLKSVEKTLQNILRTVYNDMNNINKIISKDTSKGSQKDSVGSPGNIRIVDDGDKSYIEGKIEDGWRRVELKRQEDE